MGGQCVEGSCGRALITSGTYNRVKLTLPLHMLMGETVDLAANVMRHKDHIQLFLMVIQGADRVHLLSVIRHDFPQSGTRNGLKTL